MWLLKCLKGPFFRASSRSELGNRSQDHFYRILSLFQDKFSWETRLFVRSEILGLFVKRLTADEKYSRHIRENFT